jgi:hypothetical protein
MEPDDYDDTDDYCNECGSDLSCEEHALGCSYLNDPEELDEPELED